MKIKRMFVGFTAAALAASCMAISASATKLGDVAHPSETDAEMNDAYYSIGGMAFFMSQEWSWNQGDWVGISDDGKIVIEYKISPVIADKSMSGQGTLGDMGVMINNLPDNYPFDITISDAQFVAEDGTVTEFPEINAMTQAEEDPEGGFRIHIRPTDEVDEETGEVTKTACPEVAGWEVPGAFNGGTLSMTIDFGIEAAGDDSSSADNDSSKKDESSKNDDNSKKDDTSKKDESSKKDDSSSKKDTSANNKTNGGTTKTVSTSSAAAPADNTNADTGAGEFAFAGLALAAAAMVVSKRSK